ncbi:hypothetical protein MKX08_007084 [Trichoderma sp. CBMAI-0020]|nr:hypothetical protein MKX08_007084 [Trichoderma sp. CBMAI-0020]WOD46592.1 hypothetical protein [Trichoderma atroviride]
MYIRDAAFAAANLTALYAPYLSKDTEIILPSDAAWNTSVEQRWTIFAPPTYLGAIKPATEQDVAKVVQISVSNGIPFMATGAGHGASVTLETFKNGIDIDLGNFNTVTVDEKNSLVTIGGSAQFQQVYDPLFAAGKEFPTGGGPCVGVLGATLGGGVTRLMGVHGMVVDLLQSVNIVTADGKLLTASETENSDLFWAVRGAGHNFGIITSATFTAPSLSNNGQYLNADFAFPASANRSFFEAVEALNDNLPAELALQITVTPGPGITFNAVYFGAKADGMALLQPFLDLPSTKQNISVVPWNELPNVQDFGTDFGTCNKNSETDFYGMGLKNINAATYGNFFDELAEFYTQHPTISPIWVTQRYSTKKALTVPENATAYAHRDLGAHQLFITSVTNPTDADTLSTFMKNARNEFQETAGTSELSIYVNYAHGDEGPAVWYGDNLPRLQQLKKKWDPHGRFNSYNPIC